VLPLKAAVVGLVVNEVDVAPGIGVAPSTDRRRVDEPVNDHCTVAYPVAVAVKVAVDPRDTDTDMGWRVMTGGTLTVNVAGVVVTDPAVFTNTA